jgi:hypothetical protein
MRKRKALHEATPFSYLPCDVCGAEGIVGRDVAPYWWGKPIGHKWCHSACAERYRRALVAAQRGREVEGCRQAEPEGREVAQVDWI